MNASTAVCCASSPSAQLPTARYGNVHDLLLRSCPAPGARGRGRIKFTGEHACVPPRWADRLEQARQSGLRPLAAEAAAAGIALYPEAGLPAEIGGNSSNNQTSKLYRPGPKYPSGH